MARSVAKQVQEYMQFLCSTGYNVLKRWSYFLQYPRATIPPQSLTSRRPVHTTVRDTRALAPEKTLRCDRGRSATPQHPSLGPHPFLPSHPWI